MSVHQVKFVFRRRGEMLINIFRVALWLIAVGLPMTGMAISVGTLTFSMSADNTFVAKRVLNNNPSARLYQISIVAIDRPGRTNRALVQRTESSCLPHVNFCCNRAKVITLSFTTTAHRIIVSATIAFRFGKSPLIAAQKPGGRQFYQRRSHCHH